LPDIITLGGDSEGQRYSDSFAIRVAAGRSQILEDVSMSNLERGTEESHFSTSGSNYSPWTGKESWTGEAKFVAYQKHTVAHLALRFAVRVK
jgi:hypothetical protein